MHILESEHYMRIAYDLGLRAFEIEETPIGCIVVKNGEIIGKGYNRRNTDKSVLAHAELLAIKEACAYINDWRLEGCTLFVTIEPCPMCAGAIIQSRIDKLIFGARNPKAGCCGSILNLMEDSCFQFNHKVTVIEGILEAECSQLMKDFFKNLRETQKKLRIQEKIFEKSP